MLIDGTNASNKMFLCELYCLLKLDYPLPDRIEEGLLMETLVFYLFFTSFDLSIESLRLRLEMESKVWSNSLGGTTPVAAFLKHCFPLKEQPR